MTKTNSEFDIRAVSWADAAPQLQSVRREVFVREQQVPESLEWDNQDADAEHVLACDAAGIAIATARLLKSGQIGRMAVLPSHRGKGIGHNMLSLLIASAKQKKYAQVFVHAQQSALGFYEKHGFKAHGEVFMEANIPHRHMTLELGNL